MSESLSSSPSLSSLDGHLDQGCHTSRRARPTGAESSTRMTSARPRAKRKLSISLPPHGRKEESSSERQGHHRTNHHEDCYHNGPCHPDTEGPYEQSEQASKNHGNNNADDKDEAQVDHDEVEVLYVRYPSDSPHGIAVPLVTTTTTTTATGSTPAIDSIASNYARGIAASYSLMTEMTRRDGAMRTIQTEACILEGQSGQNIKSNSTSNTGSRRRDASSLALIQSAYVQTLAEICYTILSDARWRVDGQPLFRWEQGDDLAVVTELGRHYDDSYWDDRRPSQTSQSCHNNTLPTSRTDSDTAWMEDSCMDDNHDHDRISQQKQPNISVTDDQISTDESELEIQRAMYLYCRLFYRKGPWFRLDDLYIRYYCAHYHQEVADQPYSYSPQTSNGTQTLPSPTNNAGTNKISAQSRKCNIVNESRWDLHQRTIIRMLRDIYRLRSNGYFRCFHTEEECGRVVGVSLLRADERATILAKLGGKGGKSKDTALSGNGWKNPIWKQMKQQQSLFTTDGILPVQRHVDGLVLDKLAAYVVQDCSTVDYVPAAVMRSLCERIRIQIQHSWKHITSTHQLNYPVDLHTCVRLREDPRRTLLRCCRLYLCGTGGPGTMRGDGTNGWRSVSDDSILDLQQRATSVVAPNSWHKVEFPGLLFRFGVFSPAFSQAYTPLPVRSGIDADVGHLSQVFFSTQSFLAWELATELRAKVDYLIQLRELHRYEERKRDNTNPMHTSLMPVDIRHLLDKTECERLFHSFLEFIVSNRTKDYDVIYSRFASESNEALTRMEGECDRILGCIGVLALTVLRVRYANLAPNEINFVVGRPWLRHLRWDGCIAYILWDIVPFFEKHQLYQLAIDSLQMILYGSTGAPFTLLVSNPLVAFLTSRRTRGKAFDRLAIDYNHICRQTQGALESATKATENLATKGKMNKWNDERKLLESYERIIQCVAPTSFIPFSAIRSLAKRLRRPLPSTLSGSTFSAEAAQLGLRLMNEMCVGGEVTSKKKYVDWTPLTDRAVANTLTSDNKENGSVGTRCAYVGFEETNESGFVNNSSLNVEQLAMEFYKSGFSTLGQNDSPSSPQGGWQGWHDEGGHLRALFRIMSFEVLGMDWTPEHSRKTDTCTHSMHLSPYQPAPFDLLVGYELQSDANDYTAIPINGFYFRRQDYICSFLSKLEKCSSQELCDQVYDAIFSRFVWVKSRKRAKDSNLHRDLANLRTLSAIAAGCGGAQLAASFRCLFYDYRHYSSGLPDLLLLRASYVDEMQSQRDDWVNLGDWLGESFSTTYQNEVAQQLQNRLLLFGDPNEDFLGCSRDGESKNRATNRPKNRPQAEHVEDESDKALVMPERLLLSNQGRSVSVQCLFVEVKSSNDRLDPRQEDWLNILDRSGHNARVCKFESNSKGKKSQPQQDIKENISIE